MNIWILNLFKTRNILNQNQPRIENDQSNFGSIFEASKVIKDKNIKIIGSHYFRNCFLNKQDRFWKLFNFKIFKKDRIIDKDKLPNWVKIIKNELKGLSNTQRKQLHLSSFDNLLTQLDTSEICNKFNSVFKFDEQSQ